MSEGSRNPDDEAFARVDAAIARLQRHLPASSTSEPVPELPGHRSAPPGNRTVPDNKGEASGYGCIIAGLFLGPILGAITGIIILAILGLWSNIMHPDSDVRSWGGIMWVIGIPYFAIGGAVVGLVLGLLFGVLVALTVLSETF